MYKDGWFWLFTNFSEIKSPRHIDYLDINVDWWYIAKWPRKIAAVPKLNSTECLNVFQSNLNMRIVWIKCKLGSALVSWTNFIHFLHRLILIKSFLVIQFDSIQFDFCTGWFCSPIASRFPKRFALRPRSTRERWVFFFRFFFIWRKNILKTMSTLVSLACLFLFSFSLKAYFEAKANPRKVKRIESHRL